MNCCDPFTGECKQGHGCPAREFVWPALDLPATTHCEMIKQPCATPYTYKPACRLITENSDHSDPQLAPPPSLWRRLTNYLKST